MSSSLPRRAGQLTAFVLRRWAADTRSRPADMLRVGAGDPRAGEHPYCFGTLWADAPAEHAPTPAPSPHPHQRPAPRDGRRNPAAAAPQLLLATMALAAALLPRTSAQYQPVYTISSFISYPRAPAAGKPWTLIVPVFNQAGPASRNTSLGAHRAARTRGHSAATDRQPLPACCCACAGSPTHPCVLCVAG